MNPNPATQSFVHFLVAMAPLYLQGSVERREISTASASELYYRATWPGINHKSVLIFGLYLDNTHIVTCIAVSSYDWKDDA
ncbi:MAG TPA: hypothetical protein VLD84_02350 [Nitrososphaeraceae archaeon]|nr:hypothetical protein [Nitrososphaeraceae archaeon]